MRGMGKKANVNIFLKTKAYQFLEQRHTHLFSDTKQKLVREMFAGREKPKAEWVLVTKVDNDGNVETSVIERIEKCIREAFGDVSITKRGNLKIGSLTIQRKGGDNGRKSAQMLQAKYKPMSVFNL